MKKLYIVNTGQAHADLIEKWGDFEVWAQRALIEEGIAPEDIALIDGVNTDLPPTDKIAGLIFMGSLSMVTERTDWILRLSDNIVSNNLSNIPQLGICFGHQLIAQALGGVVDYHPDGLEVGTTEIKRLPASEDDVLFSAAPETFQAQVAHYQSVLKLPEQAVLLASSDFEPHHAFRFGQNTWGFQFHPEFTPDIMRSTLEHVRPDIEEQYAEKTEQVKETRQAKQLLLRFAKLALATT